MNSKNTMKLLIIFISSLVISSAMAHDHSNDNINGKNFVKVSDRIDTSGQPPLKLLENFKQKDYDLVINLAPPQADGSIMSEGGLIAQTGTRYVNIPVDWKNPTKADFDFFSSTLNNKDHKNVLVHCQINMRGSLFTFLYRVVHEKIDPEVAYEKVAAVWVPKDHWLAFAQMILKENNIEYTFM